MTLEPIMHLKPRARAHSSQCGCALERRPDDQVDRMDCPAHARAYRAVAAILAAGRTPTQTDFFRAAHGMVDVTPAEPAREVVLAPTPKPVYTCDLCGWQHQGMHHCSGVCHRCGKKHRPGYHAGEEDMESRRWREDR